MNHCNCFPFSYSKIKEMNSALSFELYYNYHNKVKWPLFACIFQSQKCRQIKNCSEPTWKKLSFHIGNSQRSCSFWTHTAACSHFILQGSKRSRIIVYTSLTHWLGGGGSENKDDSPALPQCYKYFTRQKKKRQRSIDNSIAHNYHIVCYN